MRKEDVFLSFIFFAIWLVISGDLSPSSLFLGLMLSSSLVFLIRIKDENWAIKVLMVKGMSVIVYFAYLIVEAFISSCQVAYLVLHPELPLNPGIVKVTSDFAPENKLISMTLLANSITLTPGTLTVDINPEDQSYFIHWIDMKDLEGSELNNEIFGPFEKIIRGMFK